MPLKTSSSYSIQTPKEAPEKVFSIVTHVKHKGEQIIPDGQIEVLFDRNIDARYLQILPEVALLFTASLMDAEGNELKPNSEGMYEIYEGDELRMSGELIQHATGEPLPLRTITGTMGELTVRTYYDDSIIDMVPADPQLAVFEARLTFDDGIHVISTSAEFPGYFNYKSNIFTINALHIRGLGILPVENWQADIMKLNKSPVKVIPTTDGIQVSPREFSSWEAPVVTTNKRVRIIVEKAEDGWRNEKNRKVIRKNIIL
ncbi:hypothetical protein ES705_49885 [subsurface metagenome]